MESEKSILAWTGLAGLIAGCGTYTALAVIGSIVGGNQLSNNLLVATAGGIAMSVYVYWTGRNSLAKQNGS